MDARIARQLALADELEAEGAAAEAQYVRAAAEAEALEADQRAEGAEAPRSDISEAARPDSQALSCVKAKAQRRGPGAAFARAVVRLYRGFIASAIGARCVLEPSCSQYFLEASRKHGILGIPMIADRFVREPPESHSDRLIRTKSGQWRHHDPVEDHDWWFGK
ncbi:MAG: membrane protein insertion efficiency factor YidD [Kiritimatiellae bacterium]|nr:membrane protein insertion efficiency factor YidD [Kiritimatiellia bacterium]